jgi:hypothetical protein
MMRLRILVRAEEEWMTGREVSASTLEHLCGAGDIGRML